MDIRSLECFITVAEEGNMTRASKRLFMTQQTLSSIIQRLEREYSAVLFERKPALRLTPAGQTLLLYARRMSGTNNELKSALADVDQSCQATLRFGISRLRAEAFFPEIWERFHAEHPNIAVSIYDGRTRELSRRLSSGEISVCLAVNAGAIPGMEKRDILEESPLCCISLRFLNRYFPHLSAADMERFRREQLPISMLKGLPCIRQRSDNPAVRNVGGEEFMYNAVVESDQQATVYQLAAQGVGFGLIFPFVHYIHRAEVNRPEGDLWVLPVRERVNTMTVSLLHPASGQMKYMEDFVRITEDVLTAYARFAAQGEGEA